MKYIYISNQLTEAPRFVNIDGVNTLECKVNCVCGIEGDIYQFYRVDNLTLYTPINLTVIQVQDNLKLQCEEFIKQNYK